MERGIYGGLEQARLDELGIDPTSSGWSRITFSEDDMAETRSFPTYTPEELITQQAGPEQLVPVNLPDVEPTRVATPSSVAGSSQASLPSACSGSSAADCVESLGGNWKRN